VILSQNRKMDLHDFSLIFGLMFLRYLRENFLLAFESKRTIFGFENMVESF